MALFDTIINSIKKSMGGKKEADPKQGPNEANGEDEELVEATEVIKALTDQVEELKHGQEELRKAIQQLGPASAEDAEFKKSLGEGMIALLQGYEALAKTPLPLKGLGALGAAGLHKGGLAGAPGAPVTRHRQFTAADLDEAKGILCKAVADKKLTILEASRAETQINKSLVNPAFQIDPKFVTLLYSGAQA